MCTTLTAVAAAGIQIHSRVVTLATLVALATVLVTLATNATRSIPISNGRALVAVVFSRTDVLIRIKSGLRSARYAFLRTVSNGTRYSRLFEGTLIFYTSAFAMSGLNE